MRKPWDLAGAAARKVSPTARNLKIHFRHWGRLPDGRRQAIALLASAGPEGGAAPFARVDYAGQPRRAAGMSARCYSERAPAFRQKGGGGTAGLRRGLRRRLRRGKGSSSVQNREHLKKILVFSRNLTSAAGKVHGLMNFNYQNHLFLRVCSPAIIPFGRANPHFCRLGDSQALFT